MPVEMPDSMNSGRLDVQFGSWDSMPAATDASPGFISDVIPPEYKGSTKIRYTGFEKNGMKPYYALK